MPTLVSIAVTPTGVDPASDTLPGGTIQFTAIGTYDDASTADITTSVFWDFPEPSWATITVHGGLATTDPAIWAQSRGGTISACTVENCIGGLAGATDLQILGISQIAVGVPNPNAAIGVPQQCAAIAHFGRAGLGYSVLTADITDDATWTAISLDAQVLLSNGGFEDGDITGWDTAGDEPPTVDTTAPHSGTYSALLSPVNPVEGYQDLYRTFAVPVEGCVLSLWYLLSRDGVDATAEAVISVGNNPYPALMSSAFSTAVIGEWTQVVADLSQWAGATVDLYAFVYNGDVGDNMSLRLDDVGLHAISPETRVTATAGGVVTRVIRGSVMIAAAIDVVI